MAGTHRGGLENLRHFRGDVPDKINVRDLGPVNEHGIRNHWKILGFRV